MVGLYRGPLPAGGHRGPARVCTAFVSEDPKDGEQTPPGAEGESPEETGAPPAERMDLPTWNRSKRKRKTVQGEEEDAFQAGVKDVGRTAARRAPLFVAGAILIAGAIYGGLWFMDHSAEGSAESTRVLAEGIAPRSRGRLGNPEELAAQKKTPPNPVFADESARDTAIKSALDSLGEAHTGTPADRAAQLVRAAEAMRLGNFGDAQGLYRRFLEGGDHPLTYLAREGLVLALEGAGDLEGALTELDALVGESGSFYRDRGLWHRGRLQEALGRKDDAIATYKAYVEEFPLDKASLAREEVRGRLAELDPESVPSTPAKPEAPGIAGLPGVTP